jgi:hypothetical protein
VISSIKFNFAKFGLLDKLNQIATLVGSAFLLVLPSAILDALTGQTKRNVGRLETVIPHQIYQQHYGDMGGSSNCTILMSKQKDGLLLHTAPNITPEFVADIQALGVPVQYIFLSNELHETFASAAKEAFPDALVITPKPCRELVQEAVPVDGTVEEHWVTLEKNYGMIKMFQFDDHTCAKAERSFVIELYQGPDLGKKCLFVAQCGFGNMSRSFSLQAKLAGFQGFMSSRGRYFRLFYYVFTKNHAAVKPYWHHMVKSVDDLQLAIFQHGYPIQGKDTQEKLLKFYVY